MKLFNKKKPEDVTDATHIKVETGVEGKKDTKEEPKKAVPDVPLDKEDKKYPVYYTKEELETKIEDLRNQENVQLFLRVNDGGKKYDEILLLSELLNSK